MLQLKNIVKTYTMGDTQVEALKGIDLEFRKNDFVSILGPSGCGKTTLLNIIGGLDRYTSGDLTINGITTREYKDVDWDIYRNNSIGFVFQSYNLISHQTVYTNVELALTLAGISRAERHRRVVEVLDKVGLSDQLYKKPTQMSGGQMQRVAIARALINNPDILLADEPTGALDSETSIQIMELLKEIAQDRLVIMVTHNPVIAEKYSTRLIRLLDGEVVDDTNPYTSDTKAVKKAKGKRKKVSMSFKTALSLSFKNLLTKKTRTILTAFAGSIGIIGIALILSLSSGMQGYVNDLERDTLSQFPLEITDMTMDMGGMIAIMMGGNRPEEAPREPDMIYAHNILGNMMRSINERIQRNDMRQFKAFIESDAGRGFHEYTTSISFGYDVELQIFASDTSAGIFQVNPSQVMTELGMGGGGFGGGGMGFGMGGHGIWTEMLDNEELLRSQYDVIAGNWPQAFNEIVLVVNRRNQLSDMDLYDLGLLDASEIDEMMAKIMRGEEIPEATARSFTYNELLRHTFRLVLNTDFFVKDYELGIWVDMRDDEEHMIRVINNAIELRVVGIIRPAEGTTVTSIAGSVGYTRALTEHLIGAIREADIAREQLADPEINVFTGIEFDLEAFVENLTMEDIHEFLTNVPEEQREQAQAMLAHMSEDEIFELLAEQVRAMDDMATFENNLALLGVADLDNPTSIRLYPRDFYSKQRIEELIEDHNNMQMEAGNEQYVIHYTDFVGLMTASISSIINIVSYVLIAFVAISLVVSSIMIAIITYISVLERTKEIGILRSIGASKKDITRVFNAETVIEGFVAGTMGIAITMLLNIPINMIIYSLTDIPGLSSLPLYGAIGLIIISVVLTVIAGFIPAKMAAKKDPVVALRSE